MRRLTEKIPLHKGKASEVELILSSENLMEHLKKQQNLQLKISHRNQTHHRDKKKIKIKKGREKKVQKSEKKLGSDKTQMQLRKK